ncbi:MAG: RidA family protein [bacterium]|nr:RidA family protein [bacterium]
MQKKSLTGKGVSTPSGPYSQAILVEAKRTLHIAGQVPVDENGTLVGPGDIYAQTRKVFSNIQALCEAAGASLKNLVFLNIYVTDIRFRTAITEVRNELLKSPYPAATMVQIASLASEDWLVEIDALAALD